MVRLAYYTSFQILTKSSGLILFLSWYGPCTCLFDEASFKTALEFLLSWLCLEHFIAIKQLRMSSLQCQLLIINSLVVKQVVNSKAGLG